IWSPSVTRSTSIFLSVAAVARVTGLRRTALDRVDVMGAGPLCVDHQRQDDRQHPGGHADVADHGQVHHVPAVLDREAEDRPYDDQEDSTTDTHRDHPLHRAPCGTLDRPSWCHHATGASRVSAAHRLSTAIA